MPAATWETNDSSHRATLRASSEFTASSFRQKSHTKGVQLVLGKHSSDASVLKVQSVIFDKDEFASQADAKKWWNDNNDGVDKTYDARAGKPLDNKGIKELGGINKRVVAVHAAAESASGLYSAVAPPNEEQLILINQYTRSEKDADQLAIFPVLACNDVIDRDVDQFTTETVRGFMDLQGPLSPLGKSFMVGHNTSSLPVGRIFDGEVLVKDQVTWLKLWTYIPNTPQYQQYLENVDFGVYWAVSVGVMLGGATCSVGEAHEWGWHPYVCSAYHMKGERYDPEGETDKFGQPVPDEGGNLCWRMLESPTDFYELSQVYLGAQYFAEYDKSIGSHARKGMAKMASIKGVRTAATLLDKSQITMLSSKEAAGLSPLFPAGSKAAIAAEQMIPLSKGADGTYEWTDTEGLAWTFDPATEEELCLGRRAPGGAQEAVAAQEAQDRLSKLQGRLDQCKEADGEPDESAKGLLTTLESTLADARSALEAENFDGIGEMLDTADGMVTQLMEMLGVSDAEEGDETGEEDSQDEPTLDNRSSAEQEDELSKTAVVTAAQKAKLPDSLMEAINTAKGNGLDELMGAVSKHVATLEKRVEELAPKAVAGEAWVKELNAEAIHWYVMSQRQAPSEETGVQTGTVEKLLKLCAGNVELIKELRDQYRDLARAKFPEAVRRSTFPADVNERTSMSDVTDPSVNTEGVKRIHG